MCHDGTPPELNVFGASIQTALRELTPEPDELAFEQWFGAAWVRAGDQDPDGDGFLSRDEVVVGSDPASGASFPDVGSCGAPPCRYDAELAFRRVHLDFCGQAPSWDALQEFRSLGQGARMGRIHADLETCLDSEFWRGVGGRVWHLADSKVRPIDGLEQAAVDYALFVYASTDDRDVRDLLTATYEVLPYREPQADGLGPTQYHRMDGNETGLAERIPREHRAGMITTSWFLVQQIMFSPLPRTAAALAYRAYLGLDIAKLEGLRPVADEPRDYDAKSVDAPDCAFCHSTLDPLAYPFARYNGLTSPTATFVDDRIARYFADHAPDILDMPSRGVILGQTVNTLAEWGRVAANSEPFAQNVVRDFWTLVMGRPPGPADAAEFEMLWRGLMTEYGYRVEHMLHDLVETEAFGAR